MEPNGCGSESFRIVQVETQPDNATRQILKLFYFEGMSLRHIADRLEMAYHGVKERYRAGLKFLERELKHLRTD